MLGQSKQNFKYRTAIAKYKIKSHLFLIQYDQREKKTKRRKLSETSHLYPACIIFDTFLQYFLCNSLRLVDL